MRKGKSTSVDHGENTKEGEEAAEGGDAVEEEGADGDAAAGTEVTNDKGAEAAEKTPAEESGAEPAKEPEKTPTEASTEAPVTNGENGCTNGTAEEDTTQNHQEEEEKTTESSLVKKSKEAGGVKDDANAKIINTMAAVNSGEFEFANRDSDEPQNNHKSKEDVDNKQQALTNSSSTQHESSCLEPGLTESREEDKAPQNGGCHDGGESPDQGEREEEEDELRKRDLREAAVVIVQNVMSAATDQLERELCVNNGLNGH